MESQKKQQLKQQIIYLKITLTISILLLLEIGIVIKKQQRQ